MSRFARCSICNTRVSVSKDGTLNMHPCQGGTWRKGKKS